MVNIGQMFCNGFTGDVKSGDALPLLKRGTDAHTADAKGGELARMLLAPMKTEDASGEETFGAYRSCSRQLPDDLMQVDIRGYVAL